MRWQKISNYRGCIFDVENKPGTYGPGDYTHPKLTAIGCLWIDRTKPSSWVFSRIDDQKMLNAAESFRKIWEEADFMIGHNARRHDRKILDGFYTTLGLPLLSQKKIVDTYLDQPKMAGLSRSLENLAYRWDCPIKKLHLSESVWEEAYDGKPKAMEIMRQRVASDCQINAWLYHELVERNLLRW